MSEHEQLDLTMSAVAVPVVARPLENALFPDDMTLGEARARLQEYTDVGVVCPCCTQFAKVYRRRIHATMARDLIRVYRAGGSVTWVHLPDVIGWGGDFGKLRYWGLAQEESDLRREDGGRAGFWCVTPLGRSWIRGEATVPKYARIYDGDCLGLTGEPVLIKDALGKKFNYEELMNA